MSDKWLQAENVAKKIIITLIFIGAGLLLFMTIPKLLVLFLPFVAAYLISVIASPLTHILEKIKLPSALSAIISILFVAGILFGVCGLLVYKIFQEIYNFSASLPAIYQSVVDTFSQMRTLASDIYAILPEEIALYLAKAMNNFGISLNSFSSTIVETISSAAISFFSNIPGVFIGFVFAILSSYFIIRDKKKIADAISTAVGTSLSARIGEFRKYLSSAVLAYIKSQCILMSITFVELFIGLSALKIQYSFILAIGIAVIDAIPVFGTGVALIPWALFSLFTGQYIRAAGLIILYAVCLIVRQFLEPKVLSSQIGMHPLLTLLSVYVGFKLLGVFGMILGPLVVLIVKNFIEEYKLHM